MIRWRGRHALCFLRGLKCGLFLAGPALDGDEAKKSAQKKLKVTAVRLRVVESAAGEAWKACPENMLDKRGMRDRGLPENARPKRTMRTKVLPVGSQDLSVPRPGRSNQTLACSGWRPGAEEGIIPWKIMRTKRTKALGRPARPWIIRRHEWRVIGTSRVLLVDTPYR
jgi:hypothetical protein